MMMMLMGAGAALGPLLAGLLSAHGWNQVFYMLMAADFLALLVRLTFAPRGSAASSPLLFCLQLLLRLVMKELAWAPSRPIAAVE